MSATAILLVWFGKTASNEIRLDDLKKEAKNMGMTLLRNKDKNTYLQAVASFLVQNKKVSIVAGIAFDKVSQDDVSISQDVSWSVTQKPYLWPVLSCSVFFFASCCVVNENFSNKFFPV